MYNEIKLSEKGGRKPRSMKYFWITSTISDVLVKCITLALTSIGMIYIMIQGSGDYNLLFLAAVNLLMFAGFGLIGLTKAYDFYNDEYIPFMQHTIKQATEMEVKEKECDDNTKATKEVLENHPTEREIERYIELVKEKLIDKGYLDIHSNRRIDILDTSLDTSIDSSDNTESLVVDSNTECNSLLDRTIHTSSTTSDSTNLKSEESLQQN